MRNSTLRSERTFLVAIFILLFSIEASNADQTWRIAPSYESPGLASKTSLIIRDRSGVERTLYDQSYAVLIVEGAYNRGGWSSLTEMADQSADVLKSKLEKLGFHVLIWKDQPGLALDTILRDVRDNIGYIVEARLFFYYFGHGYSLGTTSNARTYLVPIDAPDPLTDPDGFRKVALPVSSITKLAGDMTLKHAFFALEACQSGGLFASLSAPEPPNPDGYLYGETVRTPVRQFLTAGNSSQKVPANGSFTALLTAAISGESRNADGYVYGSDVMSYVSHQLPRFSTVYPLTPQYGSDPPAGGGDFVFGRESNVAPKPDMTRDQVWKILKQLGNRVVFEEHSNELGDKTRELIKNWSRVLANHDYYELPLEGIRLPQEDERLVTQRCNAVQDEFRRNGIYKTDCFPFDQVTKESICNSPCGYVTMGELMYPIVRRQ